MGKELSWQEAIAVEVATRVLWALVGVGEWRLCGTTQRQLPDDPVLGLRAGDAVYIWNDDRDEIVEQRVAVVHGGVAYVLGCHPDIAPELHPVTVGNGYATTKSGAAALSRELIEESIEYAERRVNNLAANRSLLRELE